MFTAPQAPINLEATEKTPHAMNLVWGHPNITNGKLRRFEVQVKLVSSNLRKQEREIKVPEYRLEINVTKTSKVYSYKVSEFWNKNFSWKESLIFYSALYTYCLVHVSA